MGFVCVREAYVALALTFTIAIASLALGLGLGSDSSLLLMWFERGWVGAREREGGVVVWECV